MVTIAYCFYCCCCHYLSLFVTVVAVVTIVTVVAVVVTDVAVATATESTRMGIDESRIMRKERPTTRVVVVVLVRFVPLTKHFCQAWWLLPCSY